MSNSEFGQAAGGSKRDSFGAIPWGNPIIKDKGVCDPHIHVFAGIAYLYAGVDHSWESTTYVMKEWQIWSSPDLVEWSHRYTFRPETTYMGVSSACWATDVAVRNGRYFWYFSNGASDIGVAESESPVGPFRDSLGSPLISAHDAPDIKVYDPDIFVDDDSAATPYIFFGGCGYRVARLAQCMTELAEDPRVVVVHHAPPFGDKVGVFKRRGTYYLQWGAHYATAESVYGPYEYRGRFTDGHAKAFVWRNQWMLAKVEKDTQFYRSTSINYLMFHDDGTIPYLRNDSVGVGRYDAGRPRLFMAHYTSASDADRVRESNDSGFEVAGLPDGGWLHFPRLSRVPEQPVLHLRYRHSGDSNVECEVNGRSVLLTPTREYVTISWPLAERPRDLRFRLLGPQAPLVSLAWFSFDPAASNPKEVGKNFDFATSAQGWQAIGGTTLAWDPKGVIYGQILDRSATLRGPIFSIVDLDRYKQVRLRMRHTGEATKARLWWDVYGKLGLSEPKSDWNIVRSVEFALCREGESTHEYILDLGDHPCWAGDLKQLRLDPAVDSSEGTWSLEYLMIFRKSTCSFDGT